MRTGHLLTAAFYAGKIQIIFTMTMTGNSKRISCWFQRAADWCEAVKAGRRTLPGVADRNRIGK